MTAVNLAGSFDLVLQAILPGGANDITLYSGRIGGALLRVIYDSGTSGLSQGELYDVDGVQWPNSDLPPIPVGGLRPVVSPREPHRWYPDVSTDPGPVQPTLDDADDGDLLAVTLMIANAMVSLQFLKNWVLAFGGSYEPCPTRPE